MRRLRRSTLGAGIACLPALFPGQSLGQDTLKHDPFARPALPSRPEAAAERAAARAIPTAPDWKPELRAVMLAGGNSMVNIDGTLISLGGQINGYRLVEVREEWAVLANGSKRVKLPLRGDAIKLEGK